jgi:8-oxo-dGTP pyrophosphatase MutT (NUDIX family)
MKQLHEVQLGILKKLLFADKLRYTQMKPDATIENNTFDFHVKQLFEMNLINKDGNSYRLSSSGKEYANRIDTDTNKIEVQAKLSVWLCCLRERKGKVEVLIGTRLKQPFYGKQGFVTGKVKLGEGISEAAKRELKEETNLDGEPELILIKHYRVFDEQHTKLLEDKFMFLCKVQEPRGEIMNNNEVKLEWVALDEVKEKVTNPFEDIEQLLGILTVITESISGEVKFEEVEYLTASF